MENGKIAQVNPSPSSKVKKGQTIISTISSGTKSVAVPDLTGMTQSQACEVLAAKSLEVGSVPTSSDTSQCENLVLFSSPEAGTSMNKGESVSITLPSGKVTIPDIIVGCGESSVIVALQGSTPSVTVTEEYSEDQPIGTIVAVNPAEGSPIAQNSNVSFTVLKGFKSENQNQPGQNNNGQATYESPPTKGLKG